MAFTTLSHSAVTTPTFGEDLRVIGNEVFEHLDGFQVSGIREIVFIPVILPGDIPPLPDKVQFSRASRRLFIQTNIDPEEWNGSTFQDKKLLYTSAFLGSLGSGFQKARTNEAEWREFMGHLAKRLGH